MKKIFIIIINLILIISLGEQEKTTNNAILSDNGLNYLKQYSNDNNEVVVAIIDTGISEYLQSILKDRIVKPYNFINNSNDITDTNGHGTKITCLIACDYELTGISGINPNIRIMPLKVTDSNQSTDIKNIVSAINYAVKNDANIINISMGSYNNYLSMEESVELALRKNIIVVASVGNDSKNYLPYPAYYSGVITVASSNTACDLSNFSNYTKEVDLIVPGVKLKTIDLGSNNIITVNGTSYSTAIASGIISIFYSNDINHVLNNTDTLNICTINDVDEFFRTRLIIND